MLPIATSTPLLPKGQTDTLSFATISENENGLFFQLIMTSQRSRICSFADIKLLRIPTFSEIKRTFWLQNFNFESAFFQLKGHGINPENYAIY